MKADYTEKVLIITNLINGEAETVQDYFCYNDNTLLQAQILQARLNPYIKREIKFNISIGNRP